MMGQAKQRRMAQERVNALFSEIDLARVAGAVQRVCAAASGNLGVDCFDQALLAQSVLQRLGVHAEIVIGYAAWRVGPGGGDVISHFPSSDTIVADGGAFFHAWLRMGESIFDVTTNTLRLKAQLLDAQDGGSTMVTWEPQYLWMPMADSRSLGEVTMGMRGGIVSYLPHPALQRYVELTRKPSDGYHEDVAWAAYLAPDARVLGPNSRMAA
ncbi:MULTISPECIES: lasso peptide biosynthesis protein [Achromobacter]|uniref:Microcin J25-processing protein McjB C-terminal domain-containing protein n=3 Tax=Achromobacter TaxID=222 RepID=A0ABM8LKG4_9BURK|nr:lasso peptide biosynthesis protein [Achromobacter aegrifaciens]AVG43919.1 hypothetical protein MC81_30910 [Achromobacter insolitus]CAB3845575.1 hypothetical protein LMG3410_01496 [Achromobacter aegrifaciens]CAB3914441.1 hypothetical protein LMG3415_05153 [Achromobacter mucicolens]